MEINKLLKAAVRLIESKNDDNSFENIDDWKTAWLEAFEDHLFGCPEKTGSFGEKYLTLSHHLDKAVK